MSMKLNILEPHDAFVSGHREKRFIMLLDYAKVKIQQPKEINGCINKVLVSQEREHNTVVMERPT